MRKPLLFHYAKPCVSPGRNVGIEGYYYDNDLDMVRWLGSPDHPLAIKLQDPPTPPTKKADIEKGEDTKDKRMWR